MNKPDEIHLLKYLQNNYTATVDFSGKHLCDITFNWKYQNGYVEVSMLGYVKKLLQMFHHQPSKSPQFSPFDTAPYVKSIKGQSQYAPKIDSSSLLPPEKNIRVQKIVRSFLCYARAINDTLLPALNTISAKRDATTKQMEDQCHMLLYFVATQPNIYLIFHKSDMVLTIDSDSD